MIKKCWYSTLKRTHYFNKTEAVKAEDDYVSDYFNNMKKRGQYKRNLMKAIVRI